MTTRRRRLPAVAAILLGLLAAAVPAVAFPEPAAAASSPSGFNMSGAKDWGTSCGSSCGTPGDPPSCGDLNPDNTAADLVGWSRTSYVDLWYNPAKKASASSVSLTLIDKTLTTGSHTPDQWAAEVGGWRLKEFAKTAGTLPADINGGNWSTRNGKQAIDVAQLVGVGVYAAHYWYKCEEYHYVMEPQPDRACPTIAEPLRTCPQPDLKVKVRDGWAEPVSFLPQVDIPISYAPVVDDQSWAGWGSGPCVRTFQGELSGPYDTQWAELDNFLDKVKFKSGTSQAMPNSYDPSSTQNVRKTAAVTLNANPAGIITTQYGADPGIDNYQRGWSWCVGLKLTEGIWKTPLTDFGRYAGWTRFNSDWVSIAEIPDTPYQQKWQWLNDYVNTAPGTQANAANLRWQPTGTSEYSSYPWGGFTLLQVGRSAPTIPSGGINYMNVNEGIFYQKSCRNGIPAGYAADGDTRRQAGFNDPDFKSSPLTYISPNQNAPLDRDQAQWSDGWDPAYYYMNSCRGLTTWDDVWNPPGTPSLRLTCVDNREQPAYLAWNRAYGITGQAIQPAGGVASVRADGQTTAVNFAPKGPVYVATEGGTVDRASVEWQLRVDVPSQLGLNSPSLLGSIPAKVNDRGQPYTPVDWAGIDSQNRTPSPTWWDLATWHDIDTLTRDDSYTVTPEKMYTTLPEYKTYTYHQVQTGTVVVSRGHCDYLPNPNNPMGFDIYCSPDVTAPTYATVKDSPPAGWWDNGSQYQRNVTTLDPAPYSTCTDYGTVWRCYTEVLHDAAAIPGLGLRFYESAVDDRRFQTTATWKKDADTTAAVAQASSMGFLTGSTMDGEGGWGDSMSWSGSTGTATATVPLTMLCVSNPAGLHAQRVASTVVAR